MSCSKFSVSSLRIHLLYAPLILCLAPLSLEPPASHMDVTYDGCTLVNANGFIPTKPCPGETCSVVFWARSWYMPSASSIFIQIQIQQ
ncbi:hypothetical protein F4814DRAFT_405824 [Daldinia grandis]|nr:hypothetical protein F4814DRAFT_405824 [Daldinia grandis]